MSIDAAAETGVELFSPDTQTGTRTNTLTSSHWLARLMPIEQVYTIDVPLNERALGVPHVSKMYDVATIFGGAFPPDVQGAEIVSEALRTVLFKLLAEKIVVTGSTVTLSSSFPHDRNFSYALGYLFHNAYDASDLSCFETIDRGELPIDTLSQAQYALYSLAKDSRGPNTDIHVIDARENSEGTLRLLHAILRFSITYPFDSERRSFSIVRMPGGFSYLHLEMGGAGLNVIVDSPGKWDAWEQQHTYRFKAQKAALAVGPNGDIVMKVSDIDAKNVKISMEKDVDSLGQWQHFTARAIRTAVFQDLDTSRFDISSFLKRVPKDEKIDFRSAIGIMVNLAAAFYADPEKAMGLIKLTHLDAYLPLYKESYARELLRHKTPEIRTQPDYSFSEEYDEMVNFLSLGGEKMFRDLREKRSLSLDVHEFLNVRDVVKWYALFSPWLAPDFQKNTPSPGQREVIEPYSAGSNGLYGPGGEQIPLNAVKAMKILMNEAREKGLSCESEVLSAAIVHITERFIARKIPRPQS